MKPHITANTFASFLTAKTPERKLSIVRNAHRAMKSDKGYPPYYQSLRTPARRFLASAATNPSELLGLIVKKEKVTGRKWHLTDAAITRDAAKALLTLAPKIQAIDATFLLGRPETKAKIEYPELDLLVTPHMLVEKRHGKVRRIGALRFYTAKESTYELGVRGAELVAGMQHQWLLNFASGEQMPDFALCMVIECFQQRITQASVDAEETRRLMNQGYRDFMRLLHGLDSKDAA